MPKTKIETGTTAVYANNGQNFESKKAADNYGIVHAKVSEFSGANGLDEDGIETLMRAYSEGCFSLPKVSRNKAV